MTTATLANAVPVPCITKEQFITALAGKIVKGDMAAASILSDPKATALGFADFLQAAAVRQKSTLTAILSQVAPDSLDWLTKTLPKGPQLDAIRAALLQSRASLPATVTHYPAGSKFYKSKGTHNDAAFVELTAYDAAGKKQSECHGKRFWTLILSALDNPATLTALRAEVAKL
jgi:hypothetical protein